MHSFLADINTKNEAINIFNRVFINERGIYYLEKNVYINKEYKVNKIIVSHIYT